MTPDALRGSVVLTVVRGILGLAVGLYALIGYLLIAATTDAVPDALWLAAGGLTGALTALLVNSKSDSEPVTVDEPLAVELVEDTDRRDAGLTNSGLLVGVLVLLLGIVLLYLVGVRL